MYYGQTEDMLFPKLQCVEWHLAVRLQIADNKPHPQRSS